MSEFTLDSLLSSLSDSTAETDMEKAASESEAQPSVADQLKDTLTKEASDASTTGETNMSVETGNAIADSILAMLDGGLDKEAETHVGSPTAGNNVKVETDKMEQQHAARITQTPREGKTVTEVAKALAAKTNGGTDAVVEPTTASPEGNSEAAVAAKPSDIEKKAAFDELVAEGYSMDDAFEMVKAASEEMEAEAFELEKAAAVDALIAEGLGFEEAFELVKEASEQMVEGDEEYTDLEKSAADRKSVV